MSTIDRRTSQNKTKSKMLITLFLVIALAISMITISLLQYQESDDSSESPAPAGITYTTHAPILINDSADFASQAVAESWSGDGSQGNPYIIQGYEINSSGTNGIFVMNTSSYFIIRDCSINSGGASIPGTYGILLLACENGAIYNNSCSTNFNGIFLIFCENSIVSNNNCSMNYNGIALYYSNGTVNDNNCSMNYHGIILSSSNGTLKNNDCWNNSRAGIYLWASNGNFNDNLCSNSMFGILVYYSNDSLIIDNNYCSNNNWYGVALVSSRNSTLFDNDCNLNSFGGIFVYSSNVSVSLINNNCSNGLTGIAIFYSCNVSIIWNQLFENTNFGLVILNGSFNRIWNNTFIRNNGTSDIYDPTLFQACDYGTNNLWNSSDGYGNYWSDWATPDVVPPIGIVDNPYNINGTAGAIDYYPRTTASIISEPSIILLVPLMALAFLLISRRSRKKE